MMKPILTFQVSFLLMMPPFASAACEIVDGKNRAPFDGKSLERVMIEKKSLILLNVEFPQLNAIEKTFKGEIQTCSICEGKYVVCSE